MNGSGVQAAFKAAKLECGIEKRITVHSLRHAYTTHLMELGMEMRLVQASLGHRKQLGKRLTALPVGIQNSREKRERMPYSIPTIACLVIIPMCT